tara:strand:- start:15327 stop:15605 length:279 start_codon:yes stop_codon:yes gene_type:complete
MSSASKPVSCTVYRCSKQPEMYLYVREGLETTELPEALLSKAGKLTHVMDLSLTPERKLARVKTEAVIAQLGGNGWFLQLPPQVAGHLHFGD